MRTTVTIPTVSLVELWDRIEDKLDPYIRSLVATSSRAEEHRREEIKPWLTIFHSSESYHAKIAYNWKSHGPFDLAEAINLVEKHELIDAYVERMGLQKGPVDHLYQFGNAPAGLLSGTVKRLRKQFCLRHGLQTGRTSLMMCRILSLTKARTADRREVDAEELFSEGTLDRLNRDFGKFFIGVQFNPFERKGLRPVGIIGGEFWEQEPSGR